MSRLVDTSVWIDFFSERGKRGLPILDGLENWLKDDEVVTVLPILTELNSGSIRPRLVSLLGHLKRVDPNWNDPALWNEIAILGKRFPGVRIVDRMILMAGILGSHQVISFDSRLAKAAQTLGIGLR